MNLTCTRPLKAGPPRFWPRNENLSRSTNHTGHSQQNAQVDLLNRHDLGCPELRIQPAKHGPSRCCKISPPPSDETHVSCNGTCKCDRKLHVDLRLVKSYLRLVGMEFCVVPGACCSILPGECPDLGQRSATWPIALPPSVCPVQKESLCRSGGHAIGRSTSPNIPKPPCAPPDPNPERHSSSDSDAKRRAYSKSAAIASLRTSCCRMAGQTWRYSS